MATSGPWDKNALQALINEQQLKQMAAMKRLELDKKIYQAGGVIHTPVMTRIENYAPPTRPSMKTAPGAIEEMQKMKTVQWTTNGTSSPVFYYNGGFHGGFPPLGVDPLEQKVDKVFKQLKDHVYNPNKRPGSELKKFFAA